MRTIILKISSQSRFHFGKQSIDNKTGLSDTSIIMHSDALFSTLINNVAKYCKNKADTLVTLFREKKILISSVYYCLSNSEINIFFLPKPVNANNLLSPEVDYHKIKDVKKIRFLSKRVLEEYGERWVDNIDKLKRIGNCLILEDEYEKIETIDNIVYYNMVTHINSRPFDGESQNELFQTAFIQTPLHDNNWKTNFYFLVDDSKLNNDERKLLEFSVNLIRFEGVGGKRNVGYGYVGEVDLNPNIPFKWTPKKTHANKLTLGLTIPDSLEEFKKFYAYDIISRGGRKIDSNRALKSVNMLNEGSLLNNTDINLGKIEDISVNNDNSYLRLGTCLTLEM